MDVSSLGITGVAAITVVCYMIGQIAKVTKLDSKWIPIICGLSGAVLGVVAMFTLSVQGATCPGPMETVRWRRSRPNLASASPRAAALPSRGFRVPGVRRSFLQAKLVAGKADEAAGLAPGNEDNDASG